MSPEATPPPATEPARSTPSRTRSLPDGQRELATLALAAATHWQTSALPALMWVSKASFLTQAQTYFDSMATADAADDDRSPQAQRLRELDVLIEQGLGYVKNYLAEDHGKDGARAYYGEFGISKEGSGYRLPNGRPARAAALPKLLAALSSHHYADRKYGTAYWTPLNTEYQALVAGRTRTESKAAGTVGEKNAQEKPLRKVLKALVHLIKAHYPDTAKSVLREFGFQKESY